MTDDRQEKINRYLLGKEPNAPDFAAEIAANPELAREVKATRTAIEAITLAEDQQLRERLRRLSTQQQPAKVVPLNRRRSAVPRWIAYAAAACVLLVVGYLVLSTPASSINGAQLALAEVEPYPNIAYSSTRGDTDTAPEALAFTQYEAEDFTAAERSFAVLPDTEVNRFYLAQSQLAQGKFTEAKTSFEQLASIKKFQLAQEADFYAAVATLGIGDMATARASLNRIAAKADHPSRAEAQTLLDKL